MRVFGWVDVYLCPKCDVAYNEKSIQLLLALATPVSGRLH
jgi:hypothetical protein